MSKYYYLVTGLPDITADDGKLSMGYEECLSQLMQALTASDRRLAGYFRMTYDNRNLLAWLRDKEAAFHPLGSISAEQFQEQLSEADYDDRKPLPGVPAYMLLFLKERIEGLIPEGGEENRLTALFYEFAAQAPNAMVRNWFAFEQNLNNIQLALNCRKYGLDVEGQLVGDNEICQALANSTARDFNLSQVFPQMDSLLRISEEPDLLEREKKIDRLKWAYLDELCESCHFSVELLLAYLVKLQSLERWIALDARTGEEKFRSLIASLKENVAIPKEA